MCNSMAPDVQLNKGTTKELLVLQFDKKRSENRPQK